ncbi:MAG: transketolase [Bacilli bacterium]
MKSEDLAKQIRKDCLEMAYLSKGSHIGSALSMADILAVLYNDILNIDPKNPKMQDRDIFILSKGHGGSAVYSVLARTGFFDPEILKTHYQDGSILSGHISHKNVKGVEVSTGSLGHGVAIACGFAMAAKIDGKTNKVYTVIGDGELNEGVVWETIMFASQNKLNNFRIIVDKNKIQALGNTKDIINLDPLKTKLENFGFYVMEVDGHNHDQLRKALKCESEKPVFIIANTIKGKGVSFMENNLVWHYRNPSFEDYKNALLEIGD